MKPVFLVLVACCLSAGVYAQNQQQGQSGAAAVDQAAIDAFKKEKEKSDKDITDPKASAKASTWLDRAKTYQNIAGQYIRIDSAAATTAYEAYKKVIELDKDKKGGPGRLAKEADEAMKGQQMYGAFMQQGVAKFQSKNFADAIKSMSMAGEINPKDTLAPLYTAIAAQQIKDNATAKSQLEKYITAGGKDATIYGSLAMLYSGDNEVDKALAALDKGIALAPNNKDLSNEKINIMLRTNRIDEAITGMKQMIEKDPNNATNLVNLGILYDNGAKAADDEIKKIEGGAKKKAGSSKKLAAERDALSAINGEITRLGAAIKKQPKNADLKRQLADVQKRKTDSQATITQLEAQVKEEESSASAGSADESKLASLKQKYNEQKNLAKEYYGKALAVEPNNYDANFNMGVFYYNEAAELNKELANMDVKEYQSAKGKEVEGKVCGRFKMAEPYFLKAKSVKDEAELNDILATLQNNLKQLEGKKVQCIQ